MTTKNIPAAGDWMIEASGLTKYYGDFIAVEDISFQIPRGEVVAFLGPNGAGKSTTMKILTGYLARRQESQKSPVMICRPIDLPGQFVWGTSLKTVLSIPI